MLRSFPRFVQVVSIVSVCALAAVAPRKSLGQGNADLIVTGGKIYTVDSRDRVAEALAIAGDRIVAVGDAREIERWAGSNTRRIDLDGKTVVPGLIDAHGHFQRMGAGLPRLSFVGTTSLREIVDKVAEQAASTSKGEWITGRGWDQNDWAETEFPHHTTLSASTPDHPVWLTRVDGHAGFANALAMELSGVTRETPDPPGGRIIRDPSSGNPTGVFIDNAQGLVARRVPPLSNDRFEESVRLAIKECLRYGLTGVHDAGVSDRHVETYKRLIDRGEFDIRIYAMISSRAGPTLARYLSGRPMVGYGNHRLTVRAIKVVVDGALGSRGAALLEPYSDEPGNVGLLTTAPDRLRSITERAHESGFQVCAHAIGDRANRLVLDTFEAVLGGNAAALDHRFRIEHAQIIALPDIARFGQLGVIASIEATHATSDMYWAQDRVGPERIKGGYAWRRLLDAGARIANGSDFPVEGVNPLWGFYASITRQDRDGWPEGGWRPEERLTRAEALRSFTLDAAYAAFEEEIKGSLEPGKLADLVVLSGDIMSIEPSEILRTEVEMTILGGAVVYERE